MSESPLNLLDQNQSPEIITAYRKLRTSTIGTFNQDNFTEVQLKTDFLFIAFFRFR